MTPNDEKSGWKKAKNGPLSRRPQFVDCKEEHILCVSAGVADHIENFYNKRKLNNLGRCVIDLLRSIENNPDESINLCHPISTNIYRCIVNSDKYIATIMLEVHNKPGKRPPWKICIIDLDYTP